MLSDRLLELIVNGDDPVCSRNDMEPTTLRLSTEMLEELDQEAEAAGFSSRSEYIRYLLSNRSLLKSHHSADTEPNTSETSTNDTDEESHNLQTRIESIEDRLHEMETTIENLESKLSDDTTQQSNEESSDLATQWQASTQEGGSPSPTTSDNSENTGEAPEDDEEGLAVLPRFSGAGHDHRPDSW